MSADGVAQAFGSSVLLFLLLLVNTAAGGRFYSVCQREGSVFDYQVPQLVDDAQAQSKLQVNVSELAEEVDGSSTAVGLIFNVASFCGLTHQYLQLNALQQQYGEGLWMVGVPCNQFGRMEYAANRTELLNGLRYVRPGAGFSPLFTLSHPALVNGEGELELYTYLKSKCPTPPFARYNRPESFWETIMRDDITWNFEKFLIDTEGRPLARFLPKVEPEDLVELVGRVSDGTVTKAGLTELLEQLDISVGKRLGVGSSSS